MRLPMALAVRTALTLLASLVFVSVVTSLSACSTPPPAKRYEVRGQVLAVYDDRQELAIKHEDIVGFMPGMTMSFPVATSTLLIGRTPGELVTATLEVNNLVGTLVAITHVGDAPLPDNSNAAAMVDGILQPGDAIPDAALIDQHDRRRALSGWQGSPVLLTFVYTRCPLPTFCPAVNGNFATIQQILADDPALVGRLQLISISFDPENDTPEVLADFAAKQQSDPAVWTWLTGDRVTTDRLAAKFGVGVIRDTDDPLQVTHNLRTALVDASGHLVKIYPGAEWTAAAVLADLRALLGK